MRLLTVVKRYTNISTIMFESDSLSQENLNG